MKVTDHGNKEIEFKRALEQRLEYLESVEEPKQDITGTACENCKHFSVCRFVKEFLAAQEAINDASIVIQTEADGITQYGSRAVATIDYIESVKLRCKYADYGTNFR